MISSEIEHLLKLADESHQAAEEVTEKQALESFQWAGEFMEAVKAYLNKM
jgi:hypothetical protein